MSESLLRAVTGAHRRFLDALDDAVVDVAALRYAVARSLRACKARACVPLRDPAREEEVVRRARARARRRGLDPGVGERLVRVLVEATHRGTDAGGVAREADGHGRGRRGAGSGRPRLPRPLRRPLERGSGRLAGRILADVLAPAARAGAFQGLEGKSLAVELRDVPLRAVVVFGEHGLRADDPFRAASVTVTGSLGAVLAVLAGESDSDALFFRRELALTGDTACGLVVRHALDAGGSARARAAARALLAFRCLRPPRAGAGTGPRGQGDGEFRGAGTSSGGGLQ